MKIAKRIVFLGILLVCFLIVFLGLRRNKQINESVISSDTYTYFNEVQDGENQVASTPFVKFDAFFLNDADGDGTADSFRGATIKNKKSDKLYFNLQIDGDATLKNAKISFVNDNVILSGYLPTSVFDTSTLTDQFNYVELKEVGTGLNSFFYINVTPNIDKNISKYSSNNYIILTGTVVNNQTGEETNIIKQVTYTVDSFSDRIYSYVTNSGVNANSNTFIVTYTIDVKETENEMPLYKSYLTGTVSDLKGLEPLDVRVSNGSSNYTYTYDSTTKTFEAVKTSVINDGVIDKAAYNTIDYGVRTTKWTVTVRYPYDESIIGESVTLSATGWYEGILNGNYDTVESSKDSVILTAKLDAIIETDKGFNDTSIISTGEYLSGTGNDKTYFIDKTPILDAYKGNLGNTLEYSETWRLSSILATSSGGKVIYRQSNESLAGTNFNEYLNYQSVEVDSLGITFNGGITLTFINDETDEVLFVVKKDDYNKEIAFPDNVHRIRIETNDLLAAQNIYFYTRFKKEMNVSAIINDYDETVFKNSKNFVSRMTAEQLYTSGVSSPKAVHYCNVVFDEPVSTMKLSLDKYSFNREVSDYVIPLDVRIKPTAGVSYKKWQNGSVLIKLPSEFISVDNIRIPDEYQNNDYQILALEPVTIEGNKFVRVLFKALNDNNSTIKFNMDAIINPRTTDVSADIELYAINEGATLYTGNATDIYDVDGDGNTSESVAKSTVSVNIYAPKEVITGSSVSEFDSKGSVVVSPLVADVDPTRGTSSAKMNIFILNNSQNKVKNINIIGKVGFIGNTYQIGIGTLGTEFDTYMNGPIEVPSNLVNDVTVYYSTNETPNGDLSDSSNGWTQTPSDYRLVKTYMIKFNSDKELDVNDIYDFSFPVFLPETTDLLDKVSYFTHGAYFDYITDAGTYSSMISGSKLGVRMSRLYDLELDLFKKSSDIVKIPNGIFVITDQSDESTKVLVTDSQGHGEIKNLYVNHNYSIAQVGTNSRYSIDNTVRYFHVDNEDNDDLDYYYSVYFRDIDFDNNKLSIEWENETLYTLDLHSYDVNTNDGLKGNGYRVYGPGYENGTIIRTDDSGHAYLQNMVLGKVYNVIPISYNGYVDQEPFDIKLTRDSSNNQIAVTRRRKPEMVRTNCSSAYNFSSSDGEYTLRTNTNLSTTGHITCTLVLLLADFEDEYTLTGTASIREKWNRDPYSTLSLSVYHDMGTPDENLMTIANTTGTSSFSYAEESLNIDQSYTYDYENIGPSGPAVKLDTLKGGTTHFLKVDFNKTGYYSSQNPHASLLYLTLESKNGKDELASVSSKSNVESSDNANVMQSVTNYLVDSENNPVLTLDIANKQIETSPFTLVVRSSTDTSLIEGAQFKITGPGLPTSGKVLTTDNNGSASIDLYTSYSGSTYYLPDIYDNPNYPLENVYTLEQIYTPDGYTMYGEKIKFKVNKDVVDSSTINKSFEYDNGNKFVETDVSDGDKYIGYLDNYPLLVVTKTDYETGEVLPDTYYSIYKINEETLEPEPAYDVSDRIIGTKMVIDGKTYYIVKTNQNGQFTLNLSSGRYKLLEVKASDDKYDITDNEVYFSVGATKPYKAKGVDYVDGTYIPSEIINATSYSTKVAKTLMTSDGGTLALLAAEDGFYAVKYDQNFNEVWRSQTLYIRGLYGQYGVYFDDPGRISIINESADPTTAYAPSRIITEEESGYYISLSMFTNIYKLDKDTGQIIIQPSSFNIKPGEARYFTQLCDKPSPDAQFPDFMLKPGDDEHYYCGDEFYTINSRGYTEYSFDSNSNGFVIVGGATSFLLDSGEIYDGRSYYQRYLMKYDNNANFVDLVPITIDAVQDALDDYISEKNLTNNITFNLFSSNYRYQTPLKYFEDGSVTALFYGQFKYDNGTTFYMMFAVNVGADKQIKMFTPIGFNGSLTSITDNSYGDFESYIQIFDDGSFIYVNDYYQTGYINDSTSGYNQYEITNTSDRRFPSRVTDDDITQGLSYYAPYYLQKYDSSGNLKDVIEISIAHTRPRTLGLESFVYHSVYDTYRPYFVSPTSDGAIVGLYLEQQYDADQIVILNSGETVKLKKSLQVQSESCPTCTIFNTFLIYKVNNDSSVEWVKQLYNVEAQNYGKNFALLKNNQFLLSIPSDGNNNITYADSGEALNILNKSSSNQVSILRFEVSDEVLPEAPSSIALDLTNKRKEFNINVTSNNHGTFKVTENDTITYSGTNPELVEKVKYGDDSLRVITVTPDSGYYVKNVTASGNPLSYTLNDDGSITLDQFSNVRNNKDIYVEFDLIDAKVIVHHYLNNTNVRVASDEILPGKVGDIYATGPAIITGFEIVKDENGEYILPDNQSGIFTINDIEVTYYYELSDAQLFINYYEENTDNPLAPSVVLRKSLGSSYQTSPLDIFKYIISGVQGDESGLLISPITEVTYYYSQINKKAVTTRYVDKDTNLDIVDPTYDYYDIGDNYYTHALALVPENYEYVNSSGAESGTITDDVEVIYYYQKQKGRVVTKYLDYDTKRSITEDYVEELIYGSTYEAHKLTNIPKGYKLLISPENETGIVNSSLVELIYYFGINKGKVIVKYIDVDTKEEIKPKKEIVYNYGETYDVTDQIDTLDNYTYSSVQGNLTGEVDTDEIFVTLSYKYNKKEEKGEDKKEEKKSNNPITSDNIKIYFTIFITSLIAVLSIIFISKKKKVSSLK